MAYAAGWKQTGTSPGAGGGIGPAAPQAEKSWTLSRRAEDEHWEGEPGAHHGVSWQSQADGCVPCFHSFITLCTSWLRLCGPGRGRWSLASDQFRADPGEATLAAVPQTEGAERQGLRPTETGARREAMTGHAADADQERAERTWAMTVPHGLPMAPNQHN